MDAGGFFVFGAVGKVEHDGASGEGVVVELVGPVGEASGIGGAVEEVAVDEGDE